MLGNFQMDHILMQEYCELVIDFTRAILSWPIIILAVVIIFQKDIKSLINRIKSVGVGDKHIDFQTEEQRNKTTELEKEAERLRKELETVRPSAEQKLMEISFFESTYRLIFRDQIELLKMLRVAKEAGLRWNDILLSRDPRVLSGVTNYDFSQYMNFLSASQLLSWKLIDNNKNAIVKISKIGNEFLDYIESKGYTGIEKPC